MTIYAKMTQFRALKIPATIHFLVRDPHLSPKFAIFDWPLHNNYEEIKNDTLNPVGMRPECASYKIYS